MGGCWKDLSEGRRCLKHLNVWCCLLVAVLAHQARILEQATFSFSKESSLIWDQNHISCISCIAGRFFITEPPGKPFIYHSATLTTTAIMLCIISLILLYLITGSVYFFGHFLLPPDLLTLIQSCPLHAYNKMFTDAPCFVPMFYLEKMGA